ncbi:MAG: metallophosphoesterase family protein [Massilia sp.]
MARTRVGLISDTHGLLRPQALAFLQGCDFIIHGGDIGDPAILAALSAIAPLTVVRGNNDTQPWTRDIPVSATLQIGALRIFAIHDIKEMGAAPAGVRAVVSGHSHKPSLREDAGVFYINPGSAGRRRFSLPIAVGELMVDGELITPRIVELLV